MARRPLTAYSTATVDKLVKLSTVPFYANGTVAAQTTDGGGPGA